MKLYPNAKKEKTKLFNFPIYLISTVNPEADLHTCSVKTVVMELCNGVLLYSKFLMKCLGNFLRQFSCSTPLRKCFHDL